MPTLKIEEDQSFQANIQSQDSIPCNYSVITYKKRIRLIEMVCLEKQQIIHAAPSLGIKLSTAKHILKSFRKDGKILKKCQNQDIENMNFQKQLKELKAKIEEMNQKKKENKEKRYRLKNIKKTDFNSGKEGVSDQLIAYQPPIIKKQMSECKTSQQAHLQCAEPSPNPSQVIYYMLYNPLWLNYF